MKTLMVVSLSLLLIGCSALSGRREAMDQKNNPPLTVPKDQYDQLLAKYETLLKQNQQATPAEAPKSEDLDKIAKELEVDAPKIDPTNNKVELAETVDVFGDKGLVRTPVTAINAPNEQTLAIEAGQIESARNLVYQNQHEAAMNLLVNLENSSSRQVQVRAKYLIGEVLFNQGSYDQAMQIFEGIVENYAFSGVVLFALAKLVACTHQLKLTEKYQRYYSMLHDIFQAT